MDPNNNIRSSRHWILRRPIDDTAAINAVMQYIIRDKPLNADAVRYYILARLPMLIAQNHLIISMLMDMLHYMNSPSGQGKLVIILSDGAPPPPELAKHIVCIDYDLPNYDDIVRDLARVVRSLELRNKIEQNSLSIDQIREAAHLFRGMTRTEYFEIINYSRVKGISPLSLEVILREKHRRLKQESMLEIVDTYAGLESVGGMQRMKNHFAGVHTTMGKHARLKGVNPPRGCLVVGPPGTGKSTMSKALAYEWKLPLIRFDLGRLMSSLVGSTEANVRNSLKRIEATAPCVMQVDEIEKVFAGVSDERSGDSGTTQRAFGSLLTWMEERLDNPNLAGIYIFATSNDIRRLPPELKRRFDKVYCRLSDLLLSD